MTTPTYFLLHNRSVTSLSQNVTSVLFRPKKKWKRKKRYIWTVEATKRIQTLWFRIASRVRHWLPCPINACYSNSQEDNKKTRKRFTYNALSIAKLGDPWFELCDMLEMRHDRRLPSNITSLWDRAELASPNRGTQGANFEFPCAVRPLARPACHGRVSRHNSLRSGWRYRKDLLNGGFTNFMESYVRMLPERSI